MKKKTSWDKLAEAVGDYLKDNGGGAVVVGPVGVMHKGPTEHHKALVIDFLGKAPKSEK